MSTRPYRRRGDENIKKSPTGGQMTIQPIVRLCRYGHVWSRKSRRGVKRSCIANDIITSIITSAQDGGWEGIDEIRP
jgi:hypothetical protein